MVHNHMTWNMKFVKDYMPNDTFKFSIIRHPVSHLTSSWKYFFQSTHHTSAREVFTSICNHLKMQSLQWLKTSESLKMKKFAKYIEDPEMFYTRLRNESNLQRYRYYLRSQLFRIILDLRNMQLYYIY